MKRLSIIPLAVLAFTASTRATAQERTTVEPGMQVRVTAVGYGLGTREAWLLTIEGDAADTLVLKLMLVEPEVMRFPWEPPGPGPIRLGTDAVRIPVAFVDKFEVFRGRGVNGGRVTELALRLGVIGAALGALVEVISTSEFCLFALDLGKLGKSECKSKIGSFSWRGVGGGFAAGAFIGALYGLTPIDRWEEVPLDRLRVSVVPQSDGRFGLGLSVPF